MLQRALAGHADCVTVSEPWLLLGLLPPDKTGDAAAATYGAAPRADAIEDMIAQLPDGPADWNRALGGAAQALYERLADAQGSARYFVDKTPRYALSPQAIRAMFPQAPMIILWRNPLAVAASMMTTYSKGHWNLYRFTQDLEIALPRLVAFAQARPENLLTLTYEGLLAEGPADLAPVLAFLQLDPSRLEPAQDVALSGRMGDPTGGMNAEARANGRAAWKAQFCNPLRRAWARRYLRRIGAERLAVMGYRLDTLLAELDTCDGMLDRLFSDLAQIARGGVRRMFLTPLVAGQIRRLLRGTPMVDLE